jgi:guanosine-3',5'-bis(diphosphate) 3'-pyrophosphohydrolase
LQPGDSLNGRRMLTQKIQTGYKALLIASKNAVEPNDFSKIRRALDLSIKACGENTILTGEPEILHALSVARIIAGEVGLGLTSIITSLLHDSYNRLEISKESLEKDLGRK